MQLERVLWNAGVVMQYVDLLSPITYEELESIPFLFGLSEREAIKAIIETQFSTTEILVVYIENGNVKYEIHEIPAVAQNIEEMIKYYKSKKCTVIGIVHTHPPQSALPSIPDLSFADYVQKVLNDNIVTGVIRAGTVNGELYKTCTLYNVIPNIGTILPELEREYRFVMTRTVPTPKEIMRLVYSVPVKGAVKTVNIPIYDEETAMDMDRIIYKLYEKYAIFNFYTYLRYKKS